VTRSSNRSAIIAAATAAGLLALSGAGYRVLAHHLAQAGLSRPLPKGTLARLPLQIGPWRGWDVPLADAIIRATDADDYAHRAYKHSGSNQMVGLFVAYGVRARDLMPHQPRVCYPAAGWNLDQVKTRRLTLPHGGTLDCKIYRFFKVGLGRLTITVLNYYSGDGRYYPDPSVLRAKAWRGSGHVKYMAQVQITCSSDLAEQTVEAFATASAPAIANLLPGADAHFAR